MIACLSGLSSGRNVRSARRCGGAVQAAKCKRRDLSAAPLPRKRGGRIETVRPLRRRYRNTKSLACTDAPLESVMVSWIRPLAELICHCVALSCTRIAPCAAVP